MGIQKSAPVVMSKTERIWFSQGAGIACIVEVDGDHIMSASVGGESISTREISIDDAFQASEGALKECQKSGMGTTIMTTLNERGQVIVVSLREAKEHGLKEVDLTRSNGIWVEK